MAVDFSTSAVSADFTFQSLSRRTLKLASLYLTDYTDVTPEKIDRCIAAIATNLFAPLVSETTRGKVLIDLTEIYSFLRSQGTQNQLVETIVDIASGLFSLDTSQCPARASPFNLSEIAISFNEVTKLAHELYSEDTLSKFPTTVHALSTLFDQKSGSHLFAASFATTAAALSQIADTHNSDEWRFQLLSLLYKKVSGICRPLQEPFAFSSEYALKKDAEILRAFTEIPASLPLKEWMGTAKAITTLVPSKAKDIFLNQYKLLPTSAPQALPLFLLFKVCSNQDADMEFIANSPWLNRNEPYHPQLDMLGETLRLCVTASHLSDERDELCTRWKEIKKIFMARRPDLCIPFKKKSLVPRSAIKGSSPDLHKAFKAINVVFSKETTFECKKDSDAYSAEQFKLMEEKYSTATPSLFFTALIADSINTEETLANLAKYSHLQTYARYICATLLSALTDLKEKVRTKQIPPHEACNVFPDVALKLLKDKNQHSQEIDHETFAVARDYEIFLARRCLNDLIKRVSACGMNIDEVAYQQIFARLDELGPSQFWEKVTSEFQNILKTLSQSASVLLIQASFYRPTAEKGAFDWDNTTVKEMEDRYASQTWENGKVYQLTQDFIPRTEYESVERDLIEIFNDSSFQEELSLFFEEE